MAVRLQFISIIVPRATLATCRDLPAYFSELEPKGAVLFETHWYDEHLYCETVMSGSDAESLIQAWRDRGLRDDQVCAIASHHDPGLDWLEFDAHDNCVWLRGTERGEVFGGFAGISDK